MCCDNNVLTVLQLMKTIVMGTFVWWEDPTIGRVQWRYSGMGRGEPSVIGLGVPMDLRLCVYNSDSFQLVQSD